MPEEREQNAVPVGRIANPSYGVSVVMPAYNEEPAVRQAAARTLDAMRSVGCPFELILVDDKSLDRTGETIDALAAEHAEIRAFHHEVNLGVGGAVRTGIARARRELILFIPVDNPLEAEEIRAFLRAIADADIVVGARPERVGYTRFARFASFVYSRVLLRGLFSLPVSDPNWIPMYRSHVFSKHGVRIRHTGIFFLPEILIQAQHKGLRIREIPVRMRARAHGKATCFRLTTMARAFRDMMEAFWSRRV
jgi:glycosyltransferase involved in cell wall biosynthesis